MTRINRRSFLAEMRSLLAFMDADDRAYVLRFYEKLFDQAGEEGEGALLKKLGSPVRQVLQVEKLYRDKQKAAELSDAVGPVEDAIAAVEEPVVPAQPAEETKPVQHETVEAVAFDVPAEENAVDFSAEEEETVTEETETEVLPEPAEAEETEEVSADVPAEEVSEITEETAEEPAGDEEDEGVTEIVPAPGEEPSENEPEESSGEDEEETAEEEPKEKEPVGAGRVVAAVFVTIPMIALVLIGFALSLSLGFSSMGVGVVFGAAGGYFSGYAFGGVTAFLPDILLLAGGMLLSFCLALFFLWLGIWLAVGGVRLTIRMVAAVYRGILKRGGQDHE